MAAEPICTSESEYITWFERGQCTRAEARRFCEDDWSRYDLKVRQGHIRLLGPGDCPVHPDGECGDWGAEDEGCRCYEITEGWWDECSYRDEGAVAAWRVEVNATPTQGQQSGGEAA